MLKLWKLHIIVPFLACGVGAFSTNSTLRGLVHFTRFLLTRQAI